MWRSCARPASVEVFHSNFASQADLALVMHENCVGQLVTRLNDQLETSLTDREPDRARMREHFLQLLAA